MLHPDGLGRQAARHDNSEPSLLYGMDHRTAGYEACDTAFDERAQTACSVSPLPDIIIAPLVPHRHLANAIPSSTTDDS